MAVYGPVYENTTRIYTATLESEEGVPIGASQISAMTLTYYEMSTGEIVNGRNEQHVLNANNVTVHASSGLLTWTLQPDDTAMLLSDAMQEIHRALFEWSWDVPTRYDKHIVDILIQNLEKVP
jgi:hypothetical protein